MSVTTILLCYLPCRTVNGIVSKADASLQAAQDDVAAHLASMSTLLSSTLARINTDITAAEAKINKDVEMLQANVDAYVEITNKQFAQENDFVKYQLAGTFTLLSCLISLWHLSSHLRHYYKPDVQRRIMAVLWMVPIYSITSWLSLVFTESAEIFAGMRDCYEAYAVYTFIAMLIAILEDGNGPRVLLRTLTQHVMTERNELEAAVRDNIYPLPKLHLVPPCRCCYDPSRPSHIARAWLYQCKLMGMQFVLLKPIAVLVPLVCWILGLEYWERPPVDIHTRAVDWGSLRLYVLVCSNISVACAFFGLLTLYHGLEKELQWCNPWPKFLCIKGVVFMTFWQGMAFKAMAGAGFVAPRQAAQIQNLTTCIEMLLASLAHFYIFPYHEWADDYKREKEKGVLLRDTLALRDFVADMRSMVGRWDGDAAGEEGLTADAMLTTHEQETDLQVQQQLPEPMSELSVQVPLEQRMLSYQQTAEIPIQTTSDITATDSDVGSRTGSATGKGMWASIDSHSNVSPSTKHRSVQNAHNTQQIADVITSGSGSFEEQGLFMEVPSPDGPATHTLFVATTRDNASRESLLFQGESDISPMNSSDFGHASSSSPSVWRSSSAGSTPTTPVPHTSNVHTDLTSNTSHRAHSTGSRTKKESDPLGSSGPWRDSYGSGGSQSYRLSSGGGTTSVGSMGHLTYSQALETIERNVETIRRLSQESSGGRGYGSAGANASNSTHPSRQGTPVQATAEPVSPFVSERRRNTRGPSSAGSGTYSSHSGQRNSQPNHSQRQESSPQYTLTDDQLLDSDSTDDESWGMALLKDVF